MAHEILTPEEMYRVDDLAVQMGVKSLHLMERAGAATAREIMARYKKCRVAVLCGPGNNGGDGFVVARLLKAKGWTVDVYLYGNPELLSGDAARMARKWKGKIDDYAQFPASIGGKAGPRLIVDALFGAGLSRDFPAKIADDVSGANIPVVAIDVPSGVDGLTGQVRGASIIADLTVTFHRKKPAHVLQPGRRLCGEIVLADIGIPEEATEQLQIGLRENARPHLPVLLPEFHKFKRGHAVIWSGPELASGAARLAAMAAARSGAGLTTIAGPHEALHVHAHHVSSIMLMAADTLEEAAAAIQDDRITALCIGPAAGLNEFTHDLTLMMLRSGKPVVLDADALSVFSDAPELLFHTIQQLPERAVILTPHEGEFRRIFKTLDLLSLNKVELARNAARRSGAIVILKGSDTVVASPHGLACVNTNAPAKLATAGSGDVLAGIVTGLLAQGMEPFGSACAAVWLHAEAANRSMRRTIIAEDLLDGLGFE